MQQGTRLRTALGAAMVAMLAIAMLAPAGAAAGNGNGNGHGNGNGNGNGNGHGQAQGNGHGGNKHASTQAPAGAAAKDKDKDKDKDGVEDDATQAPAGAAPAAKGQGKGGVKRAAMQACKKGGWRELKAEDGTRFRNQGRCVSYAVHGGVLVPLVPAVTISFVPAALGTPDSCAATATLADFDPATTYEGTLLLGVVLAPVVNITTDALGDAVVPLGTFTPPLDPLLQTTLNLTVDGVSSGDVPVVCSPEPIAPIVPETPDAPII